MISMVPIAEAPPIEGLLHLCIYYLVLIEGFVTKTYLVLSILQEKARVQKIQGLPARTTPGKFKALQSTGFLFLTPTGAIYVTMCPHRCRRQPFLAFFDWPYSTEQNCNFHHATHTTQATHTTRTNQATHAKHAQQTRYLSTKFSGTNKVLDRLMK